MTKNANPAIAGSTNVGRVRQVNEDAILVNNELRLYAVADGMGGHGSGDIASQLALDTLSKCLQSDSVALALSNEHIADEQALALMFQSIVGVNQTIFQQNEVQGQIDGTGMGTTLVGLCLFGDGKRAVSFNVGDSRLYEHRHNALLQLTRDHTMYRDWEEAGRIGPAPPRNIIMRAMGLFAEVDIDMEVIPVRSDAAYLLCSDGLTGMVPDEQIAQTINDVQDASVLAEKLIQQANELGGTDNISVVVIKATG